VLGRKSCTQDQVDSAPQAVEGRLASYRQVAAGCGDDTGLPDFEPVFLDGMVLALDRHFVHRLRMVTGKDGDPLNEVDLICESLMGNDGVLRGNNVIEYVTADPVTGLEIRDRVQLTAEQFERLATAFFAELERRFLEA
jgi:hypothetical protein